MVRSCESLAHEEGRRMRAGALQGEAKQEHCCGEPRQIVPDDEDEDKAELVCITCESVIEAKTRSIDYFASKIRYS